MPKRVAVALESSTNGWGLSQLLSLLARPESTSELHLVSVKNRIPTPIPMPAVLSPADREIFCPADSASDESARVDQLLRDAAHSPVFNNYRHESIIIHAIDPVGGVREALVQFCKQHDIDLLVMGPVRESKGMSGVLRALIGFGSVSEFSLHHLDIPIALFHEHSVEKGKSGVKVMVCVAPCPADCPRDSGSLPLLKWAMESAGGVGSGDAQIHIVSCALRGSVDIVDEECGCAIGEIHEQEDQRDKEMLAMAEAAVSGARDVALGLGAKNVHIDVLEAGGGDASDVVRALTGYAARGGFDLVCVGKRGGVSTVSRTLNHWLGMGSISGGLKRNFGVPLIVIPELLD